VPQPTESLTLASIQPYRRSTSHSNTGVVCAIYPERSTKDADLPLRRRACLLQLRSSQNYKLAALAP
jgi:hypothetical protein